MSVTYYIISALSLKSFSYTISFIRTGVITNKLSIIRKSKNYVQSNSDVAPSSFNIHKFLLKKFFIREYFDFPLHLLQCHKQR